MKYDAHAKINWTLQVLGQRPDGYHEIRSIVLPVALHDTVTLHHAADISCEMQGLCVPAEKNLAYRAAVALRDATGCALGARIHVVKRIPPGAGLGGGSADAAAVLNGLNALWGLGLAKPELCAIAARVGSDVPALALGGPVLMEGRGGRVSPLDGAERAGLPDPASIVICKPPASAATPAVYREFREEDRGRGPNDLQPAAVRLYPAIGEAVRELERLGLSRVTMTGSGSAVYGVGRAPGRRNATCGFLTFP